MTTVDPRQPVVVLGGFLITAEAYVPMAAWLKQQGVLDAHVVSVSRLEWLMTTWGFGWRRVLDRVDGLVQQLQGSSPTGRVTLIGHSSGGVMLRLYLSDQPVLGRGYCGATRCNRLVTLGSPHQAVRATPLRLMVDRRLPGCYEPGVDYVAVAGELNLNGENASTFSRRTASGSYKSISGDAELRGDGLVPVGSALLEGARHLIQPETAHGGFFGKIWYGSVQRLESWWIFVITDQT